MQVCRLDMRIDVCVDIRTGMRIEQCFVGPNSLGNHRLALEFLHTFDMVSINKVVWMDRPRERIDETDRGDPRRDRAEAEHKPHIEECARVHLG